MIIDEFYRYSYCTNTVKNLSLVKAILKITKNQELIVHTPTLFLLLVEFLQWNPGWG